MSGLDLLKQIRKLNEHTHTPVIMVTGRDDTEAIQEAFQSGATSFLTKPVNLHLVPHHIRFALKAHKNEQQLAIALMEARSAEKLKDQFLANMSHELRTPLNAIIGFSELIANGRSLAMPEQKTIEYATDILNSGTHLLAIVNDVLDLAKVNSGSMQAKIEVVSLEQVFEPAIQMVSVAATNKEIGTHLENQDLQAEVEVDVRLLRQVLVNLLSNAIKFSDRHTTVRLWYEIDTSENLSIFVNDEGIGIDQSQIEQILQPFTQVENAFSRTHEGTGLGLSIAKSFVELMGGTLSITSELGAGTTVRIDLPSAARKQNEATAGLGTLPNSIDIAKIPA